MKKIIVLSVIALFLGALLLRLLQHDAGYVLIVAWGKTIEMRLSFALFLFVVIGFIWVFVLRNLKQILQWLKGVATQRVNRKQNKLNAFTEQGLHLLLQQDSHQGEKLFLNAAKLDKQTPQYYLAAARCALDANEIAKANQYLELAEVRAPDELTVLLIRADLALKQQQWNEALTLLNKAKTLAPKSAAVLKRLQQTYAAVGDWNALATLLPELEHNQVYSPSAMTELQDQVAYQCLGQFGREVENTAEEQRSSLRLVVDEYWRNLPKGQKALPKFIERYAHILLLFGEVSLVEALLRTALKNQWEASLVNLYGALPFDDPKQQLHVAHQWLAQHPEDSALQLTLGRICLRNQLWGQAKEYFRNSLTLNPVPEAYAELARLLAQLGETEGSLETYKQGLLQKAQQA